MALTWRGGAVPSHMGLSTSSTLLLRPKPHTCSVTPEADIPPPGAGPAAQGPSKSPERALASVPCPTDSGTTKYSVHLTKKGIESARDRSRKESSFKIPSRLFKNAGHQVGSRTWQRCEATPRKRCECSVGMRATLRAWPPTQEALEKHQDYRREKCKGETLRTSEGSKVRK